MQMLVCRVIETASVITYAELLASRLVFHYVLCLEVRPPGEGLRVLTTAIAESGVRAKAKGMDISLLLKECCCGKGKKLLV